ncbi:MAG: hypothetical protein KA419_20995 [Acidobacteria bacterium]|nr:hypothetical protein [Acidobacteriota bacterium]
MDILYRPTGEDNPHNRGPLRIRVDGETIYCPHYVQPGYRVDDTTAGAILDHFDDWGGLCHTAPDGWQVPSGYCTVLPEG